MNASSNASSHQSHLVCHELDPESDYMHVHNEAAKQQESLLLQMLRALPEWHDSLVTS